MKPLDMLRLELNALTFKTEALGWRLAATARELEGLQRRIVIALGEKPTEVILLRPPVKAKPRDP